MKLTRDIIFKDVYSLPVALQYAGIACFGLWIAFYFQPICGAIFAVLGFAMLNSMTSSAKAVVNGDFYITKSEVQNEPTSQTVVCNDETWLVGDEASQYKQGDKIYVVYINHKASVIYPSNVELDDDLAKMLVKAD